MGPTDEELLHEIRRRGIADNREPVRRIAEVWIPALRNRKLPKRALELMAGDLEGITIPPWVSEDTPERRALEERLAELLGLAPGEVFVDFPVKRQMMGLDLLIRRRGGAVERLGEHGVPGLMDLPSVAEALYQTTRVLRVFTFEPRELSIETFLPLLVEQDLPFTP
jgi:hypothetical protein